MKCQFYDPATDTTYTWHVNHEAKKGPSRVRNTNFESRAIPGFGVIGTQGDDQPLLVQLSGTIIHQAQFEAFHEFFNLSNTFRWTDEAGNEYEVTMTKYEPDQRRVHWNFADSNMRYHVWNWSMELWILRVISGELYGRV